MGKKQLPQSEKEGSAVSGSCISHNRKSFFTPVIRRRGEKGDAEGPKDFKVPV